MDTLARRLHLFGIFCLGLSLVLLLTLTFGFSSATVDRSAAVVVSDDENAYLGITDNTAQSTQTLSGTEEALIFVDDNIGTYDTTSTDDIDVTLEAFGNDENPDLEAVVDVPADEDYHWEVLLACGNETGNLTGTATINIEVTNGVTVDLTRTTSNEVEVTCS